MAKSESGELASLGRRLTGALIDGLISLVLTLPVMFATGVFGMIEQGQAPGIKYQFFFFLFGLVTFLLLNGWLLAKRGQTIGKLVIGTRIVSADSGTILPLIRVFGLRYFPITLVSQIPVAGNLLCLLDVIFIFRKDRRCLHDILAGTRVVNT